ncbi:MAG: DUF4376 domain-containing protein [Synergistaceae bacterium]|jgi:hypothetical protein|nr:DUF4376 domain-containing protein [Synergistaceae bacterium]
MNLAIIQRNYDWSLRDKDMPLALTDKGKLSKDGCLEITDAIPDEITPERDVARAKQAKCRELSWLRYKAINAGMTLNGMALVTDSESRGFITGTAVQAQLDSEYT